MVGSMRCSAPLQADDWAFPRSGEVVPWLIDQACMHPDSGFAQIWRLRVIADAIMRGIYVIAESAR
jgi:hypothetical protein